MQTLDSPKDLYVHSVSHTHTPNTSAKGVLEGGHREALPMRGDIRAEERENMKSVCVYDHKWKESTPAVTCLCQLYSQFLC